MILIFYVGLTGIQPSILRATLMGASVWIGQVLDRKTTALGAFLLSGFLLWFINPLWIWDLGFQLSFLPKWDAPKDRGWSLSKCKLVIID